MLRPLVLLLVVGIGGGRMLDGCLINCHEEPHAVASAVHCHQAVQPNTDSWQATSACGHDHESPSAEAVLQARADSSSKVSGLALAPDAIDLAAVFDVLGTDAAPAVHRPLFSTAFLSPLRV